MIVGRPQKVSILHRPKPRNDLALTTLNNLLVSNPSTVRFKLHNGIFNVHGKLWNFDRYVMREPIA